MTDSAEPSRAERRTGFTPWLDPSKPPMVCFDAVSRRFGPIQAVDRLSLDIYEHEFFALLGPSGCGKSTLLRMLAGFERPDEGRILLDGTDIADVPPHRRPVNMMFQSYALFPHLTVASNIAFGLKQENLARPEVAARVDEMLRLVQLDGFGDRKPHQLSGGQRQRVALARALAKRPRVLLLDEPLSALDRKLREDTRFELMELQHRLGLTFVMVTHDQDEAMAMSTRIGVMNGGRLAQVATPSDVYEHPNSRWVAGFVGDINLMECQLVESAAPGSVLQCAGAGRVAVSQPIDVPAGTALWLALRPEKIELAAPVPEANGGNAFAGTVLEIGYLGDLSVYKIRLDGGLVIKATAANRSRMAAPVARGDRIGVSFDAGAAVVLAQ